MAAGQSRTSAECGCDAFPGICSLLYDYKLPRNAHRLLGGTGMKLYYHPVSTTSRPVWLFIAENDIKCELRVVDLMKGEHYQPEFVAINPNQLVPVLEDGDFRLTESSAILKYLADKIGSPTYPVGLRQRARINERMDWFNTALTRELGYGFVYPQLFPDHRRPDASAQSA